MTAIGTSQEGTDEETIKQIALMCKQTGTVIIFRCFVPINGAAFPANGQMNPDTVFFERIGTGD